MFYQSQFVSILVLIVQLLIQGNHVVVAQCPDASNVMCTVPVQGTLLGCTNGDIAGSNQAYVSERFFELKSMALHFNTCSYGPICEGDSVLSTFVGFGPMTGQTRTIKLGGISGIIYDDGSFTLDSHLAKFNFGFDCANQSIYSRNIEAIYAQSDLGTNYSVVDDPMDVQNDVPLDKNLIGYSWQYSSYNLVVTITPIYDNAPFPYRCDRARYRPEPTSNQLSLDAEFNEIASLTLTLDYYAFNRYDCKKTASLYGCPAYVSLAQADPVYTIQVLYDDLALIHTSISCNIVMQPDFDFNGALAPYVYTLTINHLCTTKSLDWRTPIDAQFSHIILVDPLLIIDVGVIQTPACQNPTFLTATDMTSATWMSTSSSQNLSDLDRVTINPTSQSQRNDLNSPPGQVFTVTQAVNSASIVHSLNIVLIDPCSLVMVTSPNISNLNIAAQGEVNFLSQVVVDFDEFIHDYSDSNIIQCQAFAYELSLDTTKLPASVNFDLTQWVKIDATARQLIFDFSFLPKFRTSVRFKLLFTLRGYLEMYPDREAFTDFEIVPFTFDCLETPEKDSSGYDYQVNELALTVDLGLFEFPTDALERTEQYEVFKYKGDRIGSLPLSLFDNLPKFLTLAKNGRLVIQSSDNQFVGAYKLSWTTIFPELYYNITCSFDLQILRQENNFTSIIEEAFSLAQFSKPDLIRCEQKNWIYTLPEVIKNENLNQTRWHIEIEAGLLKGLIVYDAFHHQLLVNQRKILSKHEGQYSISINLYDQLFKVSSKTLNVTIICPPPVFNYYQYILEQKNPLVPRITKISHDGTVSVRFNTSSMFIPADSSSTNSTRLLQPAMQHNDAIYKYIQPSIDPNFLVTSQPFPEFKNFSLVHNSTVTLENDDYPGLEVYIKRGVWQEPTDLEFTWEITSYTNVGFDLQLQFKYLQKVSALSEDVLYLKFNDQKVFKDAFNNYVIPQFQIHKSLPRQISKEEAKTMSVIAESVSTVTKTALISNVVVNFLIEGALNQVMQAINNLQIIAHLALADIIVPVITQIFFSYLFEIITFEVVDIGEDIDNIFGHENKEAFSTNFEMVGYQSNYFITNLGTILLLIILFPLLIALVWALKTLCKCAPKIQAYFEKQFKKFFWNRFLRFIEEIYLIIAVISLLNIKQVHDGLIEMNFSYFLAIFAQLLILGFPILIIFLYCRDPDHLATLYYQDRFGELYHEYLAYKIKGRQVFVYLLISVMRRQAMACVMVFLRSYPFLQILACLALSQAVMAFVGWSRPFVGKMANLVEIASEILVILLIYHLILIQAFEVDIDIINRLGYSLNIFTIVYILIVVYYTLKQTCLRMQFALRKYYFLRKRRIYLEKRINVIQQKKIVIIEESKEEESKEEERKEEESCSNVEENSPRLIEAKFKKLALMPNNQIITLKKKKPEASDFINIKDQMNNQSQSNEDAQNNEDKLIDIESETSQQVLLHQNQDFPSIQLCQKLPANNIKSISVPILRQKKFQTQHNNPRISDLTSILSTLAAAAAPKQQSPAPQNPTQSYQPHHNLDTCQPQQQQLPTDFNYFNNTNNLPYPNNKTSFINGKKDPKKPESSSSFISLQGSKIVKKQAEIELKKSDQNNKITKTKEKKKKKKTVKVDKSKKGRIY